MLHRTIQHVTIPLLGQSENPPSDDFFFKHLLHALIDDVSLDELKKIFRMKKLDPREPWPNEVPWSEAEHIKREILAHLQRQQVVQFEVSIVTRD